jgi:hypothetical protein
MGIKDKSSDISLALLLKKLDCLGGRHTSNYDVAFGLKVQNEGESQWGISTQNNWLEIDKVR